MSKAIRDGECVLAPDQVLRDERLIDPDAGVYPMVGPGASYAQMITGDFIPSRATPAEADVAPATSMF